MEIKHIPYDIIGIILTKTNKQVKLMLNDEVLQRFVIKYSHIHPETLLLWLIKQRQKKALVIYTTTRRQHVLTISDNVLKCLCTTAIKNNDMDILKHLINTYFNRFQKKHLYGNIIKTLLNECMKCHSQEQCVLLITFIEYFIHLISNNVYVMDKHLLLKILKHNKLDKIIKLLLIHGYINSSAYYDINVVTNVISNNHHNLLKFFVGNGHKIELHDVVIGISTSNAKMIKYIMSYFKPRLYSKGFHNLLLSLTALRKNAKIYNYVQKRFK
jgi:hypothetical protein